ncbi:hypothetical protein GCM10027280_60530 [Micromonospora polyrhachis]
MLDRVHGLHQGGASGFGSGQEPIDDEVEFGMRWHVAQPTASASMGYGTTTEKLCAINRQPSVIFLFGCGHPRLDIHLLAAGSAGHLTVI